MTETMDLPAKFLGGMVGSALGDAIGEMAFRWPGEERLRTWLSGASELAYTDDTAMAIGLAQSLIARGCLEQQHLGDTFQANYRREPWRGYAQGPPALFHRVAMYSMPYAEAARQLFQGQGSYGNGAAMRIAPLGLFFHDTADLYEQAERSATVTHAHPIGVDGAAVLAWAVARAVALDPDRRFPTDQFIKGLETFARTPEMRDKLQSVGDLIAQNAPARIAAPRLGRNGALCLVHLSPAPTRFRGVPLLCHPERRRPGYPGRHGLRSFGRLPGHRGYPAGMARQARERGRDRDTGPPTG
jgi:poly(ADP-ribose) glycohydrolase ARH3